MKKDRQFALNTQNFFLLAVFCLLLFPIVGFASLGEVAGAAVFGFFALLPPLAFAFCPLYYLFDEKAVTVVYLWGQRETIEWRRIERIALVGSWVPRYSVPPRYVPVYTRTGKRPFFVNGEIVKTPKTTRLLRQYYKGNIET